MTDQTMRASSAPQFSIGNAISTTMAVFGRHIVSFSLVAVIMFMPAIILGGIVLFVFGLPGLLHGDVKEAHGGLFFGLFVVFLIYYVSVVFIMGALSYGTIQDLRKQYAGIGDCLSRAFGSVVPLSLAALTVGLLVALGTIALVVPGIMIWTALSVVGPAIVAERLSAGAGISRSRELTKGRRWTVFGTILVTTICLNIISYIITNVIGPSLGTVVDGILSLIVTVITQAFQAVLIAVIYFQLRADKDGVSLDEIAKVFD